MLIKLELSVDEVNVVLSSLAKSPYEVVQPVIDKIKGQAIPQVQPAPEPEKTDE